MMSCTECWAHSGERNKCDSCVDVVKNPTESMHGIFCSFGPMHSRLLWVPYTITTYYLGHLKYYSPSFDLDGIWISLPPSIRIPGISYFALSFPTLHFFIYMVYVWWLGDAVMWYPVCTERRTDPPTSHPVVCLIEGHDAFFSVCQLFLLGGKRNHVHLTSLTLTHGGRIRHLSDNSVVVFEKVSFFIIY